MKKRSFSAFFAVGIALVVISFSLISLRQARVALGAGKSENTVAQIETVLTERTQGTLGLYSDTFMPTLQVNGADYCALIHVPSVSVTLPLADKWNGDKLYESPARYSGSVYSRDLVIGGADNPHQLEFCKSIDLGAVITVTDMAGSVFSYAVVRVDRASAPEIEWIVNSGYDLTLFCRDSASAQYIAVRCNLSCGY